MDEITLREALIEDDIFLSKYITFERWFAELNRIFLDSKGTLPSSSVPWIQMYADKIMPEDAYKVVEAYI